MAVVHGVDVSADQHPGDEPIDWHALSRQGYRRAWIKASEALDYTNSWRTTDAHAARVAGVATGFYHVLDPALDPRAQADYCLSAVENLPRNFGIAVDLEQLYGTDFALWEQQAKAFLEALPATVERQWVYMSTWFLESMPQAPWGHKLWLAQWGPRPRRRVDCWQATGGSFVEGVPDVVDTDWWYW